VQQPRKIGFVGLGNMGWPMASRLTEAGFELTVFDLNVERQRLFSSKFRANGAASLKDVGAAGELVITMLPDGKTVRRTVFGKGQDCLADSMQPGTILVDMSSSSPTGTQELGRELSEIGIAMVDAPVSGGVSRAEIGDLAIMAGGDQEAVERCKDLFEVLGNKFFYTGHLGSGHAMKALNNMLSAAGLIAAAEVLLVGRRFGLDPDVMLEVLNSSTGRNNSTEVKFGRFVFSRSFASGFSLDFMIKDLTMAVELARDTQTPIIFSSLCRELWAAARASLGQELDHTDVVRWFENLAGATLERGKG